jgi:ABC-type sugar transport system substrate-binding protein
MTNNPSRRTLLGALALGAGSAMLPAAAAAPAAAKGRTYYYASQLLGHPYLLDCHLGMRYAAKAFGADVRTVGPQGWDPVGHAGAVEQAIAKKPAGIITSLWEPGAVPAIRRAMAQGIPVIVIEATVPDHGAMSFVGLDNYGSGVDTAKALIKFAGKKGRFVASGNWGASNTDAKVKGLTDYLKANSEWELLGRVDDKASTEAAIASSKAMFNTYKNLNAVVGLDSSSGSGIVLAAEEMKVDLGKIAVVVHDREAPVLEFIKKGQIKGAVINKTALQCYMALQMLESYHNQNGLAGVPVSANNAASGVLPFPERLFMGTALITRENVDSFMHQKIPQYR